METSLSSIRMMDENSLKGYLFNAIRACDIPTIKAILSVNRSLVNAKFYGYEGFDAFEIIKNSKNQKCYNFTGHERDGFFYPLHVAAEAGHKKLTQLLIKAGADVNAPDYRGDIAEFKCNGEAIHAFYERRGLVHQATDRYEGRLDREGHYTGQGIIFFKPEGYTSEEKLLYRGGFKYGLYHGHGTLYFPGTDVLRYVGRFSKGQMHGRGLEFDKQGQKIYQGSFRHDLRDGRGEEYADGVVVYRGEFSKNSRHGFGVVYFSTKYFYVGRLEENALAGLGIQCHPNGDRFEGMFYKNKPDGPGSYYYVDGSNPTHAMWSMSRKVKELGIAFVPKSVDLPDDSSQHLLDAMAKDEEKMLKEIENSDEEIMKSSPGVPTGRKSYSVALKKQANVDWKVIVARYCRLSIEEAKAIGIDINKETSFKDIGGTDEKGELEEDRDNDEENETKELEEDMLNEVNGVHFMDFTSLFVSYIYVYSASKVFEGRIAATHIAESVPDFEAVYHVVIDAVETYNDVWEREYRVQEEAEESHVVDGKVDDEQGRRRKEVEAKRRLFMSEADKREDDLRRQRAELAAKKGIGHLDPSVERRIQQDSLNNLIEELLRLLVDDESHQQIEELKGGDDRDGGGKKRRSKPVHKKDRKDDQSSGTQESTDIISNDFAKELLYIIRMSQNALL